MSEKRILLASLLKPVTDSRMYGKLGLSLCKMPNTQVHIAGYTSPIPNELPGNLQLHPIFNFKRLSLERVTTQKKFWALLQSIKPDLIIVCTHELLPLAWLYKRKYKCKLIYDIQENYRLNLTSQDTYHPLLKNVFGWGIRTIEEFTAPTIDHFFLAEQSYAEELPFLRDSYTMLENKYKSNATYSARPIPVHIKPESLKLLYSGTISTIYGVFDAIRLADDWYKLNSQVTLTIIGYAAHESTLHKLKQVIAAKPYITLIGGDKLVPHSEILQAIAIHDIGLLPYQPNPSTFRCIPTKLYEYMAYGLPVLTQQNPLWDYLIQNSIAGLSINFSQYDIDNLLQAIYTSTFYSNGIPDDIFWESEETKLLHTINVILRQV